MDYNTCDEFHRFMLCGLGLGFRVLGSSMPESKNKTLVLTIKTNKAN
jgi:hypothetical protein